MITQQQIGSLKDWINHYLDAHQADIKSTSSANYRKSSVDLSHQEAVSLLPSSGGPVHQTNFLTAMKTKSLIENLDKTDEQSTLNAEATRLINLIEEMNKYVSYLVEQQTETDAMRTQGLSDDQKLTVIPSDKWKQDVGVDLATYPFIKELEDNITTREADYAKLKVFIHGVDKIVKKSTQLTLNDDNAKDVVLKTLTDGLDALKNQYSKMNITQHEFQIASKYFITAAKDNPALLNHRNSGLFFLLQSIVNLWNAAFYPGAKTRLFAPESYTMVEALEKSHQNTFGA